MLHKGRYASSILRMLYAKKITGVVSIEQGHTATAN